MVEWKEFGDVGTGSDTVCPKEERRCVPRVRTDGVLGVIISSGSREEDRARPMGMRIWRDDEGRSQRVTRKRGRNALEYRGL